METQAPKVKFNVLETLISIAENSEDCKLQKTKLRKIDAKVLKLAKYLDTTSNQAFLLANIFALNYRNNEVDIDDLARYFDCTPLKILSYKSDIEVLTQKKLLVRSRKGHGLDIALGNFEFVIALSVSESILNNEPIYNITAPASPNLFDFLQKVHDKIETRADEQISTQELYNELEDLLDIYQELPFVKRLSFFKLWKDDQSAFLFLCSEVIDSGKNGEDLDRMASKIFDDNKTKYSFMNRVNRKNTELFNKRLIRIDNANFRGDIEVFLTDRILDDLFEDNAAFFKEKEVENNNLRKPIDIPRKQLFYHEKDKKAIGFLADSLSKRNFKALQKRLQSKNLPIGVNVLFYGQPGTGKTETVLQLARQTGRDIMQVDISNSKSMWFGESEKQIKRIFTQYKEACKTSKNVPILLFNEADAILGKRKAGTASNVAQTENSMLNILLEEMENMQGILIATTNLNDNLDSAFDRRFLHKIEFHKPDQQAVIKIWQSKLPGYKKHEYEELAEKFRLSGGQVENVVRKVTMQEVMHNTQTDLHTLIDYCNEEGEYRNANKVKMGF